MVEQTKTVVSVAEMARMVGLSRQRLYQLMGCTFPWPLYHVGTKRPFYTEELQQVCLEVRRRNCGIDGRPAESAAGNEDHTLCTTLSFCETRKIQIRLRPSEKLKQIEVAKNPRR